MNTIVAIHVQMDDINQLLICYNFNIDISEVNDELKIWKETD